MSDNYCTGRDGDADTKPEPATVATAARPPNSHDHELRLEY